MLNHYSPCRMSNHLAVYLIQLYYHLQSTDLPGLESNPPVVRSFDSRTIISSAHLIFSRYSRRVVGFVLPHVYIGPEPRNFTAEF